MITPISLESDIDVVAKQLATLKEKKIDRLHIDIIDGLFVDNVTVSPADLQALDFGTLQLDLHLLVDDPTEWIEECVALKPARLFAQVERMGSIDYFVHAMKSYDMAKVGLGVGIHTPVATLTDSVLSQIDCVVLMAIEMGYGGNPYHPEVVDKIKELRLRWGGYVIIDGGMKPDTYTQVMLAGASEAGANSGLWKGDFNKNWESFLLADKSLKGET